MAAAAQNLVIRMFMRIMSNTLFSLAFGGALLLDGCGAPRPMVLFALFCVVISAILTNVMLIKTIGLYGVGGLSLVHAGLAGQNPVGAVLTIIIAVLMTGAVMLLIFADPSFESKGKKSDEIPEP